MYSISVPSVHQEKLESIDQIKVHVVYAYTYSNCMIIYYDYVGIGSLYIYVYAVY